MNYKISANIFHLPCINNYCINYIHTTLYVYSCIRIQIIYSHHARHILPNNYKNIKRNNQNNYIQLLKANKTLILIETFRTRKTYLAKANIPRKTSKQPSAFRPSTDNDSDSTHHFPFSIFIAISIYRVMSVVISRLYTSQRLRPRRTTMASKSGIAMMYCPSIPRM